MLLGFDGDAADRERLLAGYLAARAERGGPPVPEEAELLTVFADLAELSRDAPADDPAEKAGSAMHSPREYFHSYLQSLDVERADLPEDFQSRLTRMLAHYGVTGLGRSPALETAVFRIFLAQRRMKDGGAIVTELLRQWLAGGPPPSRPGWRLSTSSWRRSSASPLCPISPTEWCSDGSPSHCCAVTGPGHMPPSAQTCATWTGTRTRLIAPSGFRPWWPPPSPSSGWSVSGSAGRASTTRPFSRSLSAVTTATAG